MTEAVTADPIVELLAEFLQGWSRGELRRLHSAHSATEDGRCRTCTAKGVSSFPMPYPCTTRTALDRAVRVLRAQGVALEGEEPASG
jgi:hypothetical protein